MSPLWYIGNIGQYMSTFPVLCYCRPGSGHVMSDEMLCRLAVMCGDLLYMFT